MRRFFLLLFVVILIIVVYYLVSKAAGGKFGEFFRSWQFRVSTSTAPYATSVPPKTVMVVKKPTPPSPPKVEPPKPTITPPAGFTLNQLSPYYQNVQVSGARLASTFTNYSQVTLRGDYSLKETVNATGWRLKTNRGEITIPGAVGDYGPSGIVSQGDILLKAGEEIQLYSSVSPLGRNLRLNKCTGYLNSVSKFTPSLPNNCPSFPRGEIASFSGKCQSFILSLYNCRVPTPNEINSYSGPNDNACRVFLDKVNYQGCYKDHRGDADFFSREWRAWLGENIPLDREHDRLLLFDRQGLLVDEYIY